MEHQDFKPVILNSKQKKDSEVIAKETQKRISQKVKDIEEKLDTVKIESDKKLGQQLSGAVDDGEKDTTMGLSMTTRRMTRQSQQGQ